MQDKNIIVYTQEEFNAVYSRLIQQGYSAYMYAYNCTALTRDGERVYLTYIEEV